MAQPVRSLTSVFANSSSGGIPEPITRSILCPLRSSMMKSSISALSGNRGQSAFGWYRSCILEATSKRSICASRRPKSFETVS